MVLRNSNNSNVFRNSNGNQSNKFNGKSAGKNNETNDTIGEIAHEQHLDEIRRAESKEYCAWQRKKLKDPLYQKWLGEVLFLDVSTEVKITKQNRMIAEEVTKRIQQNEEKTKII